MDGYNVRRVRVRVGECVAEAHEPAAAVQQRPWQSAAIQAETVSMFEACAGDGAAKSPPYLAELFERGRAASGSSSSHS